MIIVNARFLTQKITGVQRFAVEICKQLSVLYEPIEFVAPSDILHENLAKELNVKRIGPFKGHIWEQLTLRNYAKSKKAILLSLCNTGPLYFSNQIITVHDLGFVNHPEWYSKSFSTFYNFLIPRICRSSRHILTVSESSKRELTEKLGLPEHKITVIYNAAAEIFKKKLDSGRCSNPEIKGDYLLTVSSNHPRKNFHRLIEAFKRMERKDLSLIIIGFDNVNFKSSTISNDDEARIHFLNGVRDEELVRFYACAKLFVYPSLYEGFGIPIIEAMSQNTPVCVSDIDVFHEICGDEATYFDPYDVRDITDKITMSLKETGYIQKTNKNFSWKSSAEKLVELIATKDL